MKKTVKLMALVMVIASILLLLTGCQESNEAKYSRAQKLLSEGKYDEAIKVFDEISTYEDASKLSVYTKAIVAAEGGDYETAIKGFTALGDYKDCTMMITYYTGRQYESQASADYWSSWILAAETYDSLVLFRDSQERAMNCRKSVYDEAVRQAGIGQYQQSMEMLTAIPEYEDSNNLRRYYEAFALEQQEKYTEASRSFASLGEYKDSKNQAQAVLQRGYEQAEVMEKAGKQEAAYTIFMNLGEYSDSFERANKPYYDLGIQKREAGEWDAAVSAFAHAGAYSDAATQILETRYQEGKAKREAQDWDGAVALFTELGDYSDAATQILETYYQQAKNHYDSGNYAEAYKVFKQITGYSNVDSLLSTDEHLIAAKLALYKKVGSIVTFGQYEQDNNTGNGPEEIEWIVLDVQDGKSLLLSRYGLDAKPYNTEQKDITWEECSLRAWLNNDFLKSAFTSEELSAILLTAVDNGKSQGYINWYTRGGNNTQDYLFLLSYAEADKYLVVPYSNAITNSRVAPTAYAKVHGAYSDGRSKTADGEAAGWWWLRSPGLNQSDAASVSYYGSLDVNYVSSGFSVVRPAFWLNLESDIF